MTAEALEHAHGWASGTIAIVPVRTSGDRIQDRPLADIGGKALWTKELDIALDAGETDLSVHSMKDVESDRPGRFLLAAMLERADVRDRLVGAASLDDLPRGARIGTSSPRRAAQVRRRRPDCRIMSIRGNVETRLRKVEEGAVEATLLAAAGLDRLGIDAGHAVPVDVMLPAPGQAAIGVECRRDDERVRALLAPINHGPTGTAVALERAFTRALGGTCHSPVAVQATAGGAEGWHLHAQLLSADGRECVEEAVAVADEAAAEALAMAMLERASPAIRRLFAPA